MTLYLASEIAGTYYDVNKYEMALRQEQKRHMTNSIQCRAYQRANVL